MESEHTAGAPDFGRARRWITQSQHDLEDAEMAARAGRHALACFMCHQSAHKAVTAYLYSRGAESIWGNSLADLCQDAMVLDPSFDFIRSVAILLDKHYLGARYPSAIPGGVPAESYEAIDSESALEVANDVQAFVRERFAQLDPAKEG